MGASDETQVEFLQEGLNDVATERVRHTAVVVTPPGDVLHRTASALQRPNLLLALEKSLT